jgi:hypothetical protein
LTLDTATRRATATSARVETVERNAAAIAATAGWVASTRADAAPATSARGDEPQLRHQGPACGSAAYCSSFDLPEQEQEVQIPRRDPGAAA